MEEGTGGVREDEKFWDTTWVHGEPVKNHGERLRRRGRVRCDISIVQIALSFPDLVALPGKLENILLRGSFGL